MDMNANRYRKVLGILDLTQVSAAKFIGVDPRTSRRWALDEIEIPEPVAMLFGIMAEFEITPAAARQAIGMRWPDDKKPPRNIALEMLTAILAKRRMSYDAAKKLAK